MQEPYTKNYKILLREIEEHQNKFVIQIPANFFGYWNWYAISKVHMEMPRTEKRQTILKKTKLDSNRDIRLLMSR